MLGIVVVALVVCAALARARGRGRFRGPGADRGRRGRARRGRSARARPRRDGGPAHRGRQRTRERSPPRVVPVFGRRGRGRDRDPGPGAGPRPGRSRLQSGASAMSRSNAIAPALSRYSFQLPHFGDCTHDGQPSSHGARGDEVERRPRVARRGLERELGDPRAARIAVVHEDRRLAGLRMQRHRDAADVPAVADREQRQHADQPVFGGVHRADELRRCRCRPPRRPRAGPCTSTRA